jgi:ABC-type uncharacterized transport system substrate-binding protein
MFGAASNRFSRPGGNITGFTLMHTELNAKRLELLHTAFPHITAVAALVNPSNPAHKLAFEQTETAARLMDLGIVRKVEAESAAVLRALRPAVFSGASAVVVVPDGVFYNFRRDIVGLVNAARLPAIYPERDYADDGGLMAYGANVSDNFRRAADYVDRILKGARRTDLAGKPVDDHRHRVAGVIDKQLVATDMGLPHRDRQSRPGYVPSTSADRLVTAMNHGPSYVGDGEGFRMPAG